MLDTGLNLFRKIVVKQEIKITWSHSFRMGKRTLDGAIKCSSGGCFINFSFEPYDVATVSIYWGIQI